MSYVELKPILFKNLFEKNIFLIMNKLENIRYQRKNMLAIEYDVEQYKLIFNEKLRDSMGKHGASFLIISDRQFAYMTFKLLSFEFELKNVKILNTVNNHVIDSPDFIEDDYKNSSLEELNTFFDSGIVGRISEVELQSRQQQISIKANGVITFSSIPDDKIYKILVLIREAYNDSQN